MQNDTSATRRGVLLGAATITLAATSAYAQATPAGAARASEIAQALFDARPIPTPGLSFAAADASGVIWTAVFGKANIELDVNVAPAHRFKLQSVSKVVTATTAAKLVSRGVLDLDAPVSTWLSDLPEQHRRTTVRQLLTHQGGVRHYLPRDLDPAAPGGSIEFRTYRSNQDILDVFIDDPLIGPPGGQVFYSTFGYTLASLAMEAAAGQAFADLVKSEVGAAFNLPSLDTDTPQELRPMRVAGYNDDFARFILTGGPAPDPDTPFTWTNARQNNAAHILAGSGFIMTPSDMALFGAAHLDAPTSRITGDERALLFTPLTEATEEMPPLGLGWRVDRDEKGRRRWHHAGGYEGGRSSLVVYPDLGLSIALASNVMTVPGDVLTPSSELADAFVVE